MMHQTITGWVYLTLITSSVIVGTFSYPNQMISSNGFVPMRSPQLPPERLERKFAEKPNSIKKVALDDLDDIQTNQISESGGGGGGFSWSNLLGMIMQMLFSPAAAAGGPSKSDGLDETAVAPSPWTNLLSVGLKILTALLGGGAAAPSDGIDKVDNGVSSPLQGVLGAVLTAVVGGKDPEQISMMAKQAGEFINIVVNLLDALKTSFSHRSLAARSLGKKDSISDAAVASISMAKSYVKTIGSSDPACAARYICQANKECTADIGKGSLFCQLGSYATSFMLDRVSGTTAFDVLYEAGRRGRSGEDCRQAYLEAECNEV